MGLMKRVHRLICELGQPPKRIERSRHWFAKSYGTLWKKGAYLSEIKNLYPTSDPREPTREIELHLTGNKESLLYVVNERD